MTELIKEVETKLLLTLKLIGYLEKENFLIISGELNLQFLGEKESKNEYVEYELKDPKLIELLYSYSTPIFARGLIAHNLFLKLWSPDYF